ncbi:MAG: lipoyl(octanoyl) transferase LipB [Thermosynechococcaceae cyanobacterium]
MSDRLETSLEQGLAPRSCLFYDLGLVPFRQAWAWQQQLVCDRIPPSQLPDAFLLLEHPAVYTLGTGSSPEFLNFDPEQTSHELHRIERGGEVTYHCPGQIVGYPILNLRFYRQDLHWYLRQLEEVLIQTVADYGLEGERIEGLTGVWVEGFKVGAIGIKVSRWITMHGFALNVCPDLSGFEQIVPCGIKNRAVGSLAEFIPDISVSEVRQRLTHHFAQQLQLQLINGELQPLISPNVEH